GTGLPGEIHKVTAAGKGERVHATSDAHVRVLHADSQGRMWAGTSGSGLVLRVETSGKVVTVYDSSRAEITSIVAGAGGRIWVAASTGDTSGSGGEPISVPAAAPALSGKRTEGAPGDEGKDKPEVSVSVATARVASSPVASGRYASEIVILQEGEAPRTVWTSGEEMVFALQPASDGRNVLAATGPRGRLYRVALDGSSLERTQDEKQVTVLVEGAIGTNAAVALYRRQAGPLQGEYVSAVKDTGRTSRFGAFRWEGDAPAGTKVEFAFRSGEAAAPDSTWSPWSSFAAGATAVDAPPGRFLQWRVRLSGEAGPPRVRSVEASYRNRNSAPAVDTVVALAPNEVYARSSSGGQNVFETTAPDEKGIFTSLEEPKTEGAPRRLLRKGYRTLTWKASDPDGDPLSFDIEVRPSGSDRFLSLRKGLKEIFYSFDTTSLPDGDYVFRLTASDAEANPEDRKSASRESSPVRIDNTPPVIRKLSSVPGLFEFEAVDALSPILEAEYSVDAKEWIRVEPNDGLSDSPVERYRIRLDPKARGGFLLIRVTDSSRNVAAASFIAP
ncbi:MAG TPA: hypothetical protein VGS00_05380, partial [Thermoanaerobaculia bacterium]|nr:hypothetical protein [Thermoanaerobaculia bacterium]